jgi:hypothetical protein
MLWYLSASTRVRTALRRNRNFEKAASVLKAQEERFVWTLFSG